MRKIFFFFLCICSSILFLACQQEQVSREKSVEEIKADNKTPNSKLIRHPVSANKPRDTINVAKMTFEEEVYNFGTIDQGETVYHTFKFTNTGKLPLLITNAKSTCGCTVPTWPEEPIEPGKGGEIQVKFDTRGKKNYQSKPVTIISNTYPNETKVYLNGFVSTGEEKTN